MTTRQEQIDAALRLAAEARSAEQAAASAADWCRLIGDHARELAVQLAQDTGVPLDSL